MQQVFSIPKSMKKDFKYTFCPGCDHGVAIRLLAEVIDEFGIQDKSICATSIGCSVFLSNAQFRGLEHHVPEGISPWNRILVRMGRLCTSRNRIRMDDDPEDIYEEGK